MSIGDNARRIEQRGFYLMRLIGGRAAIQMSSLQHDVNRGLQPPAVVNERIYAWVTIPPLRRISIVEMTPAKVRLVQAAMGKPEAKVAKLCFELGIIRQTRIGTSTPKGKFGPDREKLLAQRAR